MAIVICSIVGCNNEVSEGSYYLCDKHYEEYKKDLVEAETWISNNEHSVMYKSISQLLVEFHKYKTNKEIQNENMDQSKDVG